MSWYFWDLLLTYGMFIQGLLCVSVWGVELGPCSPKLKSKKGAISSNKAWIFRDQSKDLESIKSTSDFIKR